jgi:hypothetical protein
MSGFPIVYVRYLDHVLFKDMDPAACSEPFVRGTVGRLASENEGAIQVIWERQAGYVKFLIIKTVTSTFSGSSLESTEPRGLGTTPGHETVLHGSATSLCVLF